MNLGTGSGVVNDQNALYTHVKFSKNVFTLAEGDSKTKECFTLSEKSV